MQYTFFSFREMTRTGHTAAHAIESFAAMQDPSDSKWELKLVTLDKKNENCYRAQFSLPGEPDSNLVFEYELLPHQEPGYRCTIIRKTYRNQETSIHSSS